MEFISVSTLEINKLISITKLMPCQPSLYELFPQGGSRKNTLSLFFGVKFAYRPDYGRSAKREDIGRTVKLSLYTEYQCILIKSA